MHSLQRILRPCLFGLAFVYLAQTAFAQAKVKVEPKKVATVEGITEYNLPNGVRFLLFPDPSASNVTVNMTVLVGSRHEGYGEYGMAHLLEHMLFKGCALYPTAKEVDKAFKSRGAHNNASTSLDRTNYYETMPGTDDNLKFCIQFEADRLVNCFIRKEDLAKEMTVVRNEFEQGENSPEYMLNQRMMSVAFQWHNYGKSTIGNRSDIERVPIDRLLEFYKKYYRPDNILLIVAGKFDEAKALSYVNQYFGVLTKPAQPVPSTYTEEPPQDGERRVLLRRVGKVALVGSLYHTPAAAQDDNPSLEILSTVLSIPPSGRLFKALVETKKATDISAANFNYHDPSVIEFLAAVGDKTTPEEVRDILLNVCENAAKTPFTKEEVDRAVKQYLANCEELLSNSKHVGLGLSEWAGAGDWRLFFVFRDRVAKVTAADVNRVAAKYLKRSNRTVGLFVPTEKPDLSDVPETRPSVEEIVKNYKGGKSQDLGEAFDPTPANIEARVRRLQLAGGIKVAILPKKTRGQTVVGELVLRFGNEDSLKGLTTACSLLGPLMMRGTDKYSRQDVEDIQNNNTSSVSVSSGNGTLTVRFKSKRDNLGNILDLVEEMLRHPTFPENDLIEMRNSARQELEKSMVDPGALAEDAVRRRLHPYPKTDVRYDPTFEESIERLKATTRADVLRLYKEQLGGQVGELVLVGEFDEGATLKRLDTVFAGWKTNVPFKRIGPTANTKVPGSTVTIQTPDKANADYYAGMTMDIRDDAPDYPALLMANQVLGGGAPSRFWDELREEKGLSYGASSHLYVDPLNPYAVMYISVSCNPLKINEVDRIVRKELDDMVKKGVGKEELDGAKAAYLQLRRTGRGNDVALASMLRSGLYLGRTFEYQAELDKKLAALTVDDVNRALTAHVQVGRLVIVLAGDFDRKAAPEKKK